MANSQPQLALVTDAIAAALENNLVASKIVRWKPSTTKINPLNGFKYIERVPPRYNTRRWSGTVATLAAGKQDTVFGAEIYALNSGITLDFAYEDFAHIRDEDQALRDERLRMIGQNAGEDVDADVLGKMMNAGNNWTFGTAGAAVDDIEALIEGYVRLKEEGVPDQEMFAVLPYADMGPLAKYLVQTTTANRDSQEAVLARLGNSPRLKSLVGMNILFSQQVPTLTTGTASRTLALVNGAAQGVDYSSVCVSTTTNGQFMTQTINIDGLGASATVKDGEVFTIAGVNAWDNRKGASKGRLQQFRVIGDYTATGGGALANMRIFPAIIAQNSSSDIGSVGVNNANATVSAVPANDAAITWYGVANTSYVTRAIMGRSVGHCEAADLEDLPSGENAKRQMKNVPMTLRAHRYSNGDTASTSVRFDAPYEFNLSPYGRLHSVRING
jgi:hypothetical protein